MRILPIVVGALALATNVAMAQKPANPDANTPAVTTPSTPQIPMRQSKGRIASPKAKRSLGSKRPGLLTLRISKRTTKACGAAVQCAAASRSMSAWISRATLRRANHPLTCP